MGYELRVHPEFKTDTIFLIGNGASRKGFDLNRLVGKGTIIGCNALYRDFVPDILVALDSKMLKEIGATNYPGAVLTSKGQWAKFKKTMFWKAPASRTSGAFALNFIKMVMEPLRCYCLGMDGYHGNVYQGTENYPRSSNIKFKTINPQYTLATKSNTTEFINVNTVSAWGDELPNYRFISYDRFEEELKTI